MCIRDRLGYISLSLLRTKPPASKWLVAAGPLRWKSHWYPIHGLFHHFNAGETETGFLQAYWIYTSKWSCKFSPTPGKCCTASIPKRFNSSALPTPESCNSWGELMAPPQQIISPAKTFSLGLFLVLNSTPTAFLPSNKILLTSVLNITVRFVRFFTGWK